MYSSAASGAAQPFAPALPTPAMTPASKPGSEEQMGGVSTLPRSSPRMVSAHGEGIRLLLTQMDATISCNLSIAFVILRCVFRQNTTQPGTFVFELPLDDAGTVSNITASVGSRLFQTAVIGHNDAVALVDEQKKKQPELQQQYDEGIYVSGSPPQQQQQRRGRPYNAYDPSTFRFPMANLQPGDEIDLTVTYFQPMAFSNGRYSFSLPLRFSSDMISWDRIQSLSQLLSISCSIHTGTRSSSWGSSTYPMTVLSSTPVSVALQLDPNPPNPVPIGQADFEISYNVWSDQILSAIVQEQDSFALMVSPPKAGSVLSPFGRNFVFVIDQSGSMSGSPMEHAKRAVDFCLSQLTSQDSFNIISFNDSLTCFSSPATGGPALCPAADLSAVAAAREFVRNIHAYGLTNIMAPIKQAVALLTAGHGAANSRGDNSIPFVFLLTDGAVSNEREICKYVMNEVVSVRMFTLGVGPYANKYFLKMLSTVGRGFHDHVLLEESLVPKMSSLMQTAASPILSNISLQIDAIDGCEIFPYPIPDLFCGSPLVVSGRIAATSRNGSRKQLPPVIGLFGTLPDGKIYRTGIPVVRQQQDQQPQSLWGGGSNGSSQIPVERIFAKQRLELLTAVAWLNEDTQLEQKIVNESCAMNMPCAHTQMVAYETTPQQQQQQQPMQSQGNAKSRSGSSAATSVLIAGAAVGAILVLGTSGGPSLFGNVAATMSNANVASAMVQLGAQGLPAVTNALLQGAANVASAGVQGAQYALTQGTSAVANIGSGIGNCGDGCCCSLCCPTEVCSSLFQVCGNCVDGCCGVIGQIDCSSIGECLGNAVGPACECFCACIGGVLSGLG